MHKILIVSELRIQLIHVVLILLNSFSDFLKTAQNFLCQNSDTFWLRNWDLLKHIFCKVKNHGSKIIPFLAFVVCHAIYLANLINEFLPQLLMLEVVKLYTKLNWSLYNLLWLTLYIHKLVYVSALILGPYNIKVTYQSYQYWIPFLKRILILTHKIFEFRAQKLLLE